MVSSGIFIICMVGGWLMVVIAVPVLSSFLWYLYYLDGWRMVDGCACVPVLSGFPWYVSLLSGWL